MKISFTILCHSHYYRQMFTMHNNIYCCQAPDLFRKIEQYLLYAFQLILLLCVTGCKLITLGQSNIYKAPELFTENWEYSWDYSINNNKRGDSYWHKVTLPLSHLEKQSNTIWLRTTLPVNLPMHPALYIRELYLSVIVYVDDIPIYSFWDLDKKYSKEFIAKKSHVIPIPDSAAGKTIYFKIQSNYPLIGITSPVYIGSEYSLIKQIIVSDFDNISIACISFFIGIFALMIFIANRKQWEYFYFGFFALSQVLYITNYTSLRDFLIDAPLLWIYLWLFSSVWSTTMFIGFVKVIFNYSQKSVLGILFFINIVYAIFESILLLSTIGELCITGTIASSTLILHARYIFQYLLAADAIVILLIILQQLKQGNKDAAILLAGLVVLSITVLHSVAVAIGFFTKDFHSYIHWGVCILLIALSIILIRQYTLMQEKIVLNKADMNIARDIQQSIISIHPPQQEKLTIASEYIPAKIVGGDFFDYVTISDHETGIIIADITGHGVSAALIASMCKIAFHASSDAFTNPQVLLEKINATLIDKTAGQLLSVLYVYINTLTNTLIASSAGHPRCIIMDRISENLIELYTKGRIIGAFERLNCTNTIHTLDSSHRIILYTDGIIEALNYSRVMYGENNFIKAIKQTIHLTPREACSYIKNDVLSWVGKDLSLLDDITLIVIDITQ